MNRRSKTLVIIVGVLVLATLGAVAVLSNNSATSSVDPPVIEAPKAQPSQPLETFDKTSNSLTDPSSVWVIVNKQHPLTPQTYTPDDLRFPAVSLRIPGAEQMKMRDQAATALEAMFAAAKAEDLNLQITTAFRGFNYQKVLYDGYVAKQGQTEADTLSARPGFSEHQTGWAADIRPQSGECYLVACFGQIAEGTWLAANAYKYGFIIRYPEGKAAITGYEYEPWHVRFVDNDLATELHEQGIQTLEEFFAVSGGQTYTTE